MPYRAKADFCLLSQGNQGDWICDNEEITPAQIPLPSPEIENSPNSTFDLTCEPNSCENVVRLFKLCESLNASFKFSNCERAILPLDASENPSQNPAFSHQPRSYKRAKKGQRIPATDESHMNVESKEKSSQTGQNINAHNAPINHSAASSI